MRLGDIYPIVPTNAIVGKPAELADVPLRSEARGAVYVRDVATVTDGADLVTSYALVNGHRTVYIPVTKRAEASTLAVVSAVKANLGRFQAALPPDIKVSYEFDQSPVVWHAINELVKEAGLGAVLTGMMVLLFLRDWRSAFIVIINIPISLLAAAFALWLSGQSVNLMTLGGLALAVGILVDESTVAIENIHTRMAAGATPARAAADAIRETAMPRLLAMLCILAMFIPALFMEGAAGALFKPLALAVGFAMIASYLLSSSLVPVLSIWFLRHGGAISQEIRDAFLPARLFRYLLRPLVALRWLVVPIYLAAASGFIWLAGPRLGSEIFPRTEAGQFALRISFEPADITSRVMAFGSNTPIEVAVNGSDLTVSKAYADKILAEMRRIPELRDAQIAQELTFPAVRIDVDRERAGQLGVNMQDVTRAMVAATTSSRFTQANFWSDPTKGVSYNVQVQIPQTETKTLEDLGNVPVPSSSGTPVLLRNLAQINQASAVGQYERYNMVRVVSITANYHGIDLGGVLTKVRKAILAAGALPPKTTVELRGQAPTLAALRSGFMSGLAIAIPVLFLLLAANFQSWRLALAVVSTLPAVLAGVIAMLLVTGTTLNIQSAIGTIMAVGVAVANAILLVTFAERERKANGGDARAGAMRGAVSRLRPILMTSCAMIAGMLPMALNLGGGAAQMAPLGRAVAGGLILATAATLFILPAFFALLAGSRSTSVSLDPDDPLSELHSPPPA